MVWGQMGCRWHKTRAGEFKRGAGGLKGAHCCHCCPVVSKIYARKNEKRITCLGSRRLMS